MNNYTCKICNNIIEGEKQFNKHIKSHKLTQEAYYTTYYPRYDMWSSDLIKFKNLEFYLNNDFNNRHNLCAWLKNNSEEKFIYARNLLSRRKKEKNLIYSPSQVELETSILPDMEYYNSCFHNRDYYYHDLCNELGFKNKTRTFAGWKEVRDISNKTIFIDSREQKRIVFKNSLIRGLPYGDYALNDDEWTGKTYIERKSLTDFIGTFSSGIARFEREIIRAKDDGAYLIILVEEDLTNVINYKELGIANRKIKTPIEFVFHNVRELIQKHNNIQFLFCGNSKLMIEKIFKLGKQVQNFDLQYLYESGEL